MSCDCYCHVAIPHGVVGWSAVCDSDIPDHTHLLFSWLLNAAVYDHDQILHQNILSLFLLLKSTFQQKFKQIWTPPRLKGHSIKPYTILILQAALLRVYRRES